ncbi:hypothetical protein BDZ97DRAFT_1862974, partial [Flammula alnicola]
YIEEIQYLTSTEHRTHRRKLENNEMALDCPLDFKSLRPKTPIRDVMDITLCYIYQ